MPGSPIKRARRKRFEQWSAVPANYEAFLALIANGGNLTVFCRDHDFPRKTICDWIDSDPHRANAYARATHQRADCLAEEHLELADKPIEKDADGKTDIGAVQHRRLQLDARRWAAAKLHPKKYDDRLAVDQQISGTLNHSVDINRYSDEQLLAVLRRGNDIPDDEEISDARLLEMLEKHEKRHLGLLAQQAEARGIKRPECLQIGYDKTAANDVADFFDRLRPPTKAHRPDEGRG